MSSTYLTAIIMAMCLAVKVSATCTYGDIKLVNGGTQYEGRIEVCVSNQWGTICDDYWSTPMFKNAQVACRQLGFSDEGAQTRASNPNDFTQLFPPFGQGSGPILWDDVRCTGSEQRLSECLHINHTGACIHTEDVGVTCQPLPEGEALTTTTTSATTGGGESLSTIDTSTFTNQPPLIPDIGGEFFVDQSTQRPQNLGNRSGGNQTSTDGLNVARLPNNRFIIIIAVVSAVVLMALVATVVLCVCIGAVIKRRHRETSCNVYENEGFPGSESKSGFHYKGTLDGSCVHPGTGQLGDNICYATTTFKQHEVRPTLDLAGPSIETQATTWNTAYGTTASIRSGLRVHVPSTEAPPTTWNVAYSSVNGSVTIHNDEANVYESIDETRQFSHNHL